MDAIPPSANHQDAPAARPWAVTIVTTEHFTLQSARAATIAESTGRATMFLSSVSGGLVARSGWCRPSPVSTPGSMRSRHPAADTRPHRAGDVRPGAAVRGRGPGIRASHRAAARLLLRHCPRAHPIPAQCFARRAPAGAGIVGRTAAGLPDGGGHDRADHRSARWVWCRRGCWACRGSFAGRCALQWRRGWHGVACGPDEVRGVGVATGRHRPAVCRDGREAVEPGDTMIAVARRVSAVSEESRGTPDAIAAGGV